MIEITAKGLTVNNPSLISGLKQEFAEKRCIVIPQLISQTLLHKASTVIESASSFENQHVGNGGSVFSQDLTIKGDNLALSGGN